MQVSPAGLVTAQAPRISLSGLLLAARLFSDGKDIIIVDLTGVIGEEGLGEKSAEVVGGCATRGMSSELGVLCASVASLVAD